VAVAAGMCTATLDTQTAGDVLRPAAYNGVVGLKPTFGWVATTGSQPVAPSIDTFGVIAHRVQDAAAVARAVADDPVRFTATERTGAPRLGVLTAAFARQVEPVMRDHFDQLLRRLAGAGAAVAEVSCPVDLDLVHAAHRIITFAECAAEHPDGHAGYGPRARDLLDLGSLTPAPAYLHAQHVRDDATGRLAAMFTGLDVIALPRDARTRTGTRDHRRLTPADPLDPVRVPGARPAHRANPGRAAAGRAVRRRPGPRTGAPVRRLLERTGPRPPPHPARRPLIAAGTHHGPFGKRLKDQNISERSVVLRSGPGGGAVPEISFPVEVVEGVPVVTAPEEIDIANAAGLRAALLEVAEPGRALVVVDMSRTRFCDSAGLNALVAAARQARAEGGEVRLVGEAVARIVALTGVDRVIPVYASLEDALI